MDARTTVALLALTLSLSAACTSPPPDAPEPDGKALVTEMTEAAWNRGEVAVLTSTMSDTVVFHYGGTARALTREQMSATVLRWREAFPDLEMRVEELVQEGELVAARFTLTGTQEGPWLDQEPTGRTVSMPLMMFFRVEDRRVVELWEVDDQLGLRRQLGLLP